MNRINYMINTQQNFIPDLSHHFQTRTHAHTHTHTHTHTLTLIGKALRVQRTDGS